jgi:hypothetical protein
LTCRRPQALLPRKVMSRQRSCVAEHDSSSDPCRLPRTLIVSRSSA